MPTLNMRLSQPKLLIDINRLAALEGISLQGDNVRIGALARHVEVANSPIVAEHLPLIAEAMPHVAHVAVRNRGTFGGSIALADPAAELPACALALGATFVLARARRPARDRGGGLLQGPLRDRAPARRAAGRGADPGEEAGSVSVFMELARRHGDFAIAGVAFHLEIAGGVVTERAARLFRQRGQADARAQSARGDPGQATRRREWRGRGCGPGGGPRADVQSAGQRQDAPAPAARAHATRARGGGETGGSGSVSDEETLAVSLTVNGERVSRTVPVRQHLVDFLRIELGLTGAHLGCEHGICGACSVRVDGVVVRGCLMLAVQADGADVVTIEGLCRYRRDRRPAGGVRRAQRAAVRLSARRAC